MDRLQREKSEFPPEEAGFGPLLRDIFGENWRTISGYELRVKASDFTTMAHLYKSIGAFQSIRDAQRNGVVGPVTKGVHFIRIRGDKHRVIIE